MAVTRKEQIASGKKVTPLTREELRLAGKTFAPLTEDERFQKVAYSGGGGGGGGETEKVTVTRIAEQDVTVESAGQGLDFYVGMLDGGWFFDEKINVTYDDVLYSNVPSNDGGAWGATVDQVLMAIDFSVYPFMIQPIVSEIGGDHLVMIATSESGTHTIKVEAEQPNAVKRNVRVPEQTLEGEQSGSAYMAYPISIAFQPVDDAKVEIYFDGTKYDCDYNNGCYGGTEGRTGVDFGDYPFVLVGGTGGGNPYFWFKDGNEHVVKVIGLQDSSYPYGNLLVTENGYNIDVIDKKTVDVQVPAPDVPRGRVSITITDNTIGSLTAYGVDEKNKIKATQIQYGTPGIIYISHDSDVYAGDTDFKARGAFLVVASQYDKELEFSEVAQGVTLEYMRDPLNLTNYLVYVEGVDRLNPVHLNVAEKGR